MHSRVCQLFIIMYCIKNTYCHYQSVDDRDVVDELLDRLELVALDSPLAPVAAVLVLDTVLVASVDIHAVHYLALAVQTMHKYCRNPIGSDKIQSICNLFNELK